MKVTVLQENLARGLSIVSRAVSPRNTLPVLSNILIASDEGRLRLSATNLELGITCWIAARIEQEGSTTVPARTFADLVSALPVEQVMLELNTQTQTLHVKGGTSTNDIKCISADEFPPLPVPDLEGAVQLNVVDFQEMIQQVAFAASTDEARPVLMGVLVNVDKDKITLAAADGFRLSVRKATLSSPLPQPLTAIIPARALNELARRVLRRRRADLHGDAQGARPGALPREGCGDRLAADRRDVPGLPADHPARLQVAHAGLDGLAAEGLQAGGDLRPRGLERGAAGHQVGAERHAAERSGDLGDLGGDRQERDHRRGHGGRRRSADRLQCEVPARGAGGDQDAQRGAGDLGAERAGVVRPVGDENFLQVIMPMHLG